MKKPLKQFLIIALAAVIFISWSGLEEPSGSVARLHTEYRGKNNVLQVSPGSNGYSWAVLSYNLNEYSGQRITINVSMQVWLDKPTKILWQINNDDYPIIAGSFDRTFAAGQWHTVQGSNTITLGQNKILYLSTMQFGNVSAYFADFTVTINGKVVNEQANIVIDNTLPALYTKWSFPVGTAIVTEDISEISPQRQLLRHFNILSAGNHMKPDYIMPSPWTPNGAYRWADADRIVSYVETNGKKIRGHTLFWHSQTPDAFFKGSGAGGYAPINEFYTRMENHTKTVFQKYRSRIEWWDVVNEPVGDNGGPRADSPYTRIMTNAGLTGMDRYQYILKAFQWARQYADANGGRNVKLYLNEYGIENSGAKQNEFSRLVDWLIQNDAPIDGIGFQCHIRFDFPDAAQISRAIDLFSSKTRKDGVKLMTQVTELDISIFNGNETNWGNLSSSRLTVPEREINTRVTQQSRRYRELFDMFEQKYKEGKLDMVQIWGVDDGHSWLNSFPVRGRVDYPLLFDRGYQPKPAYNELIRGR